MAGQDGAGAQVYKKGVTGMVKGNDILQVLEREARAAGYHPYRAESLARDAAYCAVHPSAPLSSDGMRLFIVLGGGRVRPRKELVACPGW